MTPMSEADAIEAWMERMGEAEELVARIKGMLPSAGETDKAVGLMTLGMVYGRSVAGMSLDLSHLVHGLDWAIKLLVSEAIGAWAIHPETDPDHAAAQSLCNEVMAAPILQLYLADQTGKLADLMAQEIVPGAKH